tara:strand:- start:640 stop:1323 length:684 start_codon:yes stop_codon:yes gene_type:complete
MLASAIIPAAGSGKRFGEKKQLKDLNGRPLIYYTLIPFIESTAINDIIIAARKNDVDKIASVVDLIATEKKVKIIEGGDTRQSSIYNALAQTNSNTKYVCVHDAARPFVSRELIEKLIYELKNCKAVTVGHKSTDTLKEYSDGIVTRTLDRKKIWQVQTPQAFAKEVIVNAYELAKKQNILATDDSSLAEKAGYQVKIINDSSINFKITTQEDWIMAEALLRLKKNV